MAKTAVVYGQQRWEYLSVVRRTESSLEKEFNELGQGGWELVSVDHGKDSKGEMCWTAFLKRPATQSAPAPAGAAKSRAVGAPSAEAQKAVPSASPDGFDLSGEEFGVKEE